MERGPRQRPAVRARRHPAVLPSPARGIGADAERDDPPIRVADGGEEPLRAPEREVRRVALLPREEAGEAEQLLLGEEPDQALNGLAPRLERERAVPAPEGLVLREAAAAEVLAVVREQRERVEERAADRVEAFRRERLPRERLAGLDDAVADGGGVGEMVERSTRRAWPRPSSLGGAVAVRELAVGGDAAPVWLAADGARARAGNLPPAAAGPLPRVIVARGRAEWSAPVRGSAPFVSARCAPTRAPRDWSPRWARPRARRFVDRMDSRSRWKSPLLCVPAPHLQFMVVEAWAVVAEGRSDSGFLVPYLAVWQMALGGWLRIVQAAVLVGFVAVAWATVRTARGLVVASAAVYLALTLPGPYVVPPMLSIVLYLAILAEAFGDRRAHPMSEGADQPSRAGRSRSHTGMTAAMAASCSATPTRYLRRGPGSWRSETSRSTTEKAEPIVPPKTSP